MSAVVASAQDVTNHFASYVILVFVAPVIAVLATTAASALVPCVLVAKSHVLLFAALPKVL